MSTAAEPTVPAVLADRAPARAWAMFTTVLTWAVFLQAVTAGRILTGDESAPTSTAPPPASCSS